MSIILGAKEAYNENSDLYKHLSNLRKHLTETYTTLRYLQDSSTNFSNGLKILDLGCGGGEFLLEALNHGADFVAGMDLSSSMISSASTLLASFPTTKYSLVTGNSFDNGMLLSTFPNVQFDNIIANWLISYAESPQILGDFFASCRTILKPGGRIFGICPNESLIERTQESLSKRHTITSKYEILNVENDFAYAKVTFVDPQSQENLFELNVNIYKKQCIRRLLEENGFEVLKLSPIEFSSEIVNYGFTPSDFRAYTEEIGVVYCFLAESKDIIKDS